MTIWRIDKIDKAFIAAWQFAGEPDQAIIHAYLTQQSHRPPSPQKHPEMERWYYLLADNPRIRLACIDQPLDAWLGLAAKVLVGTNEIIGEFANNRSVLGQRGLQLQCQPITWLSGEPDKTFSLGSALFAEISEQVLDLQKIAKSQQFIQQKYEHKRR